MNEYFTILLKEIQRRGGEIPLNDFYSLLPFDPTKEDYPDKMNAPLRLKHSNLVEERIVITPEGKKFLEENK